MKSIHARSPLVLLTLGALLLIMSQMRLSVGLLAWLAPIPWLAFLRKNTGARSLATFVAVCVLTWTVATVKIVTDPLPISMAPLFGVPMGLAFGVPYIVWAKYRKYSQSNSDVNTYTSLLTSAAVFTSTYVLMEWLMYTVMPFGTWGALVNTQLDQLPLLQLASLTGLHGITALVCIVAVSCEAWLALASHQATRVFRYSLAILGLAYSIGQCRLEYAAASHPEAIRVAAVGTNSNIGASAELPSPDEQQATQDYLFAHTTQAALGGARLVVWNEGAAMVWPADEDKWQSQLATLARENNIDLVAAYIVVMEQEPLLYENKYVYIHADGSIDHSYLKHFPVPGEPAIQGAKPAPITALSTAPNGSDITMSGALCYDYDFPQLSREHAASSVDLVALPSSDWLGIDPVHTKMAIPRAIEGGHSVLRSTRYGLSAAIDPWGNIRAQSSHFDHESRILFAELPTSGVVTIYASISTQLARIVGYRLSDWFVLTQFALLMTLLLAPASRVFKRRRAQHFGDSTVR